LMDKSKLYTIIFILLGNLGCFALWWWTKDLFEYDSPGVFWFLLAIPAFSLVYYFRNDENYGRVLTTDANVLDNLDESPMAHVRHIILILRIIAFTLLIIAIARPQSKTSYEDLTREGIDIVLALDVSHSMLAQDFKPNRLESAKKVAKNFVDNRVEDRIGLVVYEGESFTQVPITSDHRVVKAGLTEIEPGWITGGTAIGMGLATAVNRMKTSAAKSKVVILLTDGVNNSGQIKPLDAAQIAKAFGIRVYTIGVGTKGKAKMPVARYQDGSYAYDWVDVEIDEEVLGSIAQITGGEYFRAENEASLVQIYQDIDQLERTKFNVTRYSNKTEEFFWFAFIAVICLCLEFLFKHLILRITP
jgi:Ca-activated chloride channel homolog